MEAEGSNREYATLVDGRRRLRAGGPVRPWSLLLPGFPNLDSRPASTAPFTVLLLGSDDDSKFPPDRLNTQSMILVRVDPGSRQATMLSIPRDLWVPIPNEGSGKISWAYQVGGAEAAIAAVETNFKVHVDDYVWIGLNGLVRAGARRRLRPGLDLTVRNKPFIRGIREPSNRMS